MPNDLGQRAIWTIISSSQGTKRVKRMKDWSIKDDSSREGVTEVGSRAAVAFMQKPGAKTITLNIRETKGAKPDIDWDALNKLDEVFAMTKAVVGGREVGYPECMVSNVSPQGDDQGENTYSVEIIALDDQAM